MGLIMEKFCIVGPKFNIFYITIIANVIFFKYIKYFNEYSYTHKAMHKLKYILFNMKRPYHVTLGSHTQWMNCLK